MQSIVSPPFKQLHTVLPEGIHAKKYSTPLISFFGGDVCTSGVDLGTDHQKTYRGEAGAFEVQKKKNAQSGKLNEKKFMHANEP